jgi:transcriptional regulator with XRE-family HTH domain
MAKTERTYPLRVIRESRNLSAKEVAERGNAINPNFPTYQEIILGWERRGTDRHSMLATLAQVYEIPLDEIAKAAQETLTVS